ncbi:sickle tail protein [Symphorus nematophorus]
MSKSSSRLGRPGSAGSKSPSLRKELQGNRSCMLRIGERLMRAGSEGNLVQRTMPAQHQSRCQAASAGLGERLNGQTQTPALDKPTEHTGNNSSKASHSPSTLPQDFATAAEASSSRDDQLDSLLMQHCDVERKKEVFLDHLRQKYPHHAAIIMGHQDHPRKQTGSPRPSESPPCAGVLGLAVQQDPLASEAMSDGEVLPPTAPFTRGCKARASLPVGRSSGQTRERSLGVLYLQYGEETKQVRMPAEISSEDAVRALFVTAFPHQLTMKMLQSPNMAIYIKDTSRNVYYDLEDIRNITSHSCLKVYHKDPAHVFNRHARPANTEGRISKEVLYGSHSPVHTLSSSSRSTLHSLQGSMSPPMVRSMPSSPSRMAYVGGSTGGGVGLADLGSATLPRECLSGARRSSTLCNNSSAILERRDVKPDEDAASSKSMALVVRGEGGPHYPDSYCSSLQDGGGGRLSITSSQCSAPPSLTADVVDAGVTGIPGGLQQYRASIKPLMGYGESMEHQTRSLHRQKSRKYGDSQIAPLGTTTPPSSPHRVSDVRMMDGQIIGGVGLVSPERMSPIRRSLRRESNGAAVEIVNRSRGSGSTSSASSVFVDSPLGQPERLFQSQVTASNAQSERMKAMEEQIASLAGLVHHALSMGADIPGVKDTVSDTAGCKLFNNRPRVSSEPQNTAVFHDGFSPAPLALQAPPSDSSLQQSLVSAKRNVCELRLQLNQLRDLQLSNQESVSSMLRMAGQELVLLMCDRLAQAEEAAYRHRTEMEEERIHYLATEERIILQLSELEDYVERWQRSAASGPGQLLITLRDVEEAALSLRRVGEAVAILRGEFPELQAKMRSVLRLEVEAVRFLKEEPHKMDSMLKRVKALTEALSSLRRCVSESIPPARSGQVEPLKVLETDQGPLKPQSPQSSPKPQPRSSVRPPVPTSSLSGSQAEASLVAAASPVMARRMKSTPQPHHHPSPPLTPTHGRDSPSVAKVSPRSREGSPALQKRLGPLQSDGLCTSEGGAGQPAQTATQESHTTQATVKHTCTHAETKDGHPPEVSLSVETRSMNHSITGQANQPARSDSSQPLPTNTSTDQVLQEAPASPIKSNPEVTESNTRDGHSDSALGQITSTASVSEQDTPLDLTLQASVEQQASRSDTQEDTPPRLSDEVDSTQFKSAHTALAASSQLPAATVEPPPSAPPSTPPSAHPSAAPSSAPPSAAPPSTERGSRPHVEKPRRSSVDKEMKQSPDRAGKSPPPPPPRRFHAVSSGLTTGRSGEVIFTTRTDPVGAQEEGEKEKELPVVPQPKPPRQPPDVKPKPQMCAPAPLAASSSSPAAVSSHRDDEEEEEEDNKFIKELQVFQKCTLRDVGSRDVVELSASEFQSRGMEPQVTTELSKKINLPGENEQWKGEVRTSPTPQVANQNPSELATSDHQLAPQLGITDGCPHKLVTAAGLEEHSEVGKVNPDKKKKAEEKVVKQVPSLNCAVKKVEVPPPVALQDVQCVQKNEEVTTPSQMKAERMEALTVTTSQKENDLTVNTPDQINKEAVGPVCSPTTAEKKVKFTTIVTLQKENLQATDIASLDQTNKKPVREVPAEKKSNVMVVVTLQKENTPEDCSTELSPMILQEKSLGLDQEGVVSTKVLNPSRLSPSLNPSHSRQQQNQEVTAQVSSEQSQYSEEGGSLSPDTEDDEGPPPPPPPPTGKIRISKTRAKTSSSDIQTVAGDGASEPTYLGHENQGFEDRNDTEKQPIIVILDEPLDIQSAFKRLSTIFECEEDLDRILSAENIVDEEVREQKVQKQDMREICFNQINWDLGQKGVAGNSQNSLHMQSQRPSADYGSVLKNQDQGKQECTKIESKRKFKFKFPKNKLAAISQAIRTGTIKTGKKTLEVVVTEEEEEETLDNRPVKETKKQTQRFEISSTTQFNFGEGTVCDRNINVPLHGHKSPNWAKELCKTTFDSIDCLEESIKQLEISVDKISAPPPNSSTVSSPPQSPYSDRAQLKGKAKQERERSPSKRPASQILKGPNPPQSKKAKAQLPHDSGKTSTKKQTSKSSSSSSAQRPHTKSLHSSSSSSPEKSPKGQKQATQKQPSQPHPVTVSR